MLGLLASLWFCVLIGHRPLANPDEGRYTEIPREMALSGDYVTPRLNGLKYFEKPPLLYWLSAVTFKAAGVSPFTTRLWNSLFAVGGVLLTYAAGRALYGRSAGIGSAIVLSTSLLYYVLGQVLLLDMAVAVTMSGALFAFLLAVREPAGRKRFLLFLACYTFMALATLTKGLIGFLLPGAVMFLWLLLLNQWKRLRPFHPFTGTLLFLLIAAPWHVLAARANPDFAYFYFIHEHFLRFSTRIHGRYEPWWFFLPILIGGLLPWTVFAWQAVKRSLAGGWKARTQNAEAWFLFIWIVFIVLFFSKSQSKLIPYILPVFPAAAVLIGRHLSEILVERTPGWRAGAWAFVGIGLALVVAMAFAPSPEDQPALAHALPAFKTAAGLALGLAVAAVLFALKRGKPRLGIGAMASGFSAFLVIFNLVADHYDASSTRPLCAVLKPLLKPNDRVFNLRLYAQDMPVELGRLVTMVHYRGELDFGIGSEPEVAAAGHFLTLPCFEEQWREPHTAYAVMHKWDYDFVFSKSGLPFQVLASTRRYVLVVNHPPEP